MTDNEARNLLDLPRGYLAALLSELWEQEQGFSGKRPFGNSGWQYDLYVPMVRAGLVPGTVDEDGDLDEFNYKPAGELIQRAIAELGR